MLPEDRDENEDRGDENDGERNLRYGSRGERFDFSLASSRCIFFFVPAWECSEQEEADKRKNDSDDASNDISNG